MNDAIQKHNGVRGAIVVRALNCAIKKLLKKRGETLTEALVSILIIALSAAMLATMISAAVNLNITTDNAAKDFYLELTDAETGLTQTFGDATVNGTPVDVTYYGASGGLTAYVER